MKYGQQLPVRSVPQWAAYNMLYSDLKNEIKELTRGPISYSGYTKLVEMFTDELNNVGLFVKSKVGELNKRLDICERTVEAVSELDNSGDGSRLDPAIRENKIYGLHLEVSKLAQEIQQLSRFIGVQYTGFRKLIKKYRKWAGPNVPYQLEEFERKLESRSAFAHVDFAPMFLELARLYDVIRERKFTSIKTASYKSLPLSENSSANNLCQYDVELLCSLSESRRFWIHPDNFLQVKLILLQNMTLVSDSSSSPFEDTEMHFLDTPNLDFASTAKTPGVIIISKSCRANSSGRTDKSVPILCAPTGGIRKYTATQLNEQLFDQIINCKLRPSSFENADANGKLALRCIVGRGLKPTVTVYSNQCHFETIDSSGDSTETVESSGVIRATIDSNIRVQREDETTLVLPYLVLEINRTRSLSPEWLASLEKSHLLYPLDRSFSLYTYALLASNPKSVENGPQWLDVLRKRIDIRRTPEDAQKPAGSRRLRPPANTQGRSILLNDRENTAPGLTPDEGSVSPVDIHFVDASGARYWNEFDDPENDFDRLSMILSPFDDNKRNAIQAERLSRPLMTFGRKVHKSVKRIRSALGLQESDRELSTSGETQSLLHSCTDEEPFSPRLSAARDEDPFGETADMAKSRQELVITVLTTMCLSLAGTVEVLIYLVLLSEDLDLLSFSVQLVAVTGLAFSVILSGLGAAAFNMHYQSSWLNQVLVQSLLLTIVCFGVGGIIWVIAN